MRDGMIVAAELPTAKKLLVLAGLIAGLVIILGVGGIVFIYKSDQPQATDYQPRKEPAPAKEPLFKHREK